MITLSYAFLLLIVGYGYCATLEPWLTLDFISISRAKVFQDELYIADRAGILYRIENDDSLTPILDISDRVLLAGFTGFLNFEFPPWFDFVPCVFLWYGTPHPTEGASKSRISVIPVDPDTMQANTAEEIILFTLDNPTDRHVGGFLEFATDLTLLFAFGDGSNFVPSNSSQNPNDFHGKMLRYTVSPLKILLGQTEEIFSIPQNNPVHGSPIYALGFRQPFECNVLKSLLPFANPRLFCYENGANSWEEVNLVEKGVNLGWPCQEGFERTNFDCGFPLNSQRSPLLVYPHSSPSGNVEPWNKIGNSISPGYIYDGSVTALKRSLLFGDLSGALWIAQGPPDQTLIEMGSWVFDRITHNIEPAPSVISVFADVDGQPIVNTLDFDTFTTTFYRLVL